MDSWMHSICDMALVCLYPGCWEGHGMGLSVVVVVAAAAVAVSLEAALISSMGMQVGTFCAVLKRSISSCF